MSLITTTTGSRCGTTMLTVYHQMIKQRDSNKDHVGTWSIGLVPVTLGSRCGRRDQWWRQQAPKRIHSSCEEMDGADVLSRCESRVATACM